MCYILQDGSTPADEAKRSGHHKVAKLIESYQQKVCIRITIIMHGYITHLLIIESLSLLFDFEVHV